MTVNSVFPLSDIFAEISLLEGYKFISVKHHYEYSANTTNITTAEKLLSCKLNCANLKVRSTLSFSYCYDMKYVWNV